MVGGLVSGFTILYRQLYHDYIADLVPLVITPMGFFIVYFAKSKLDELSHEGSG